MESSKLLQALRDPPSVLRRLQHIPGLYLAGGLVRDACWGIPTRDIDLVAPAPLQPVLEAISAELGGEPFELNRRFASHRLVTGKWELDITPMHVDGPEADIARRDYTVNALLVPVSALGEGFSTGDLLCHAQSQSDLDHRILRMVSPDNLEDDPVRILRGYRLAATRSMQPTDATRSAWSDLAGTVTVSAPERLHDELLRWFAAETITETIEWCATDGVLWELFPALKATVDCGQNNYHDVDVWRHTLRALTGLEQVRRSLPEALVRWAGELDAAWTEPVSGAAAAGTLTRLALLLHDAGKPLTREVQPDGRITFHTHQDAGAEVIDPRLEELKFAGVEREFITLQIREHLRLGFYSDHLPLRPRLAYRFLKQLGRWTPMAILHALADCSATGGMAGEGGWDRHVAAAAQVLDHFYSRSTVAAPPLLLDGKAIMKLLGIDPGCRVGELKEALLEATAAGEVATVAEAEELVRRLQAGPPPDKLR